MKTLFVPFVFSLLTSTAFSANGVTEVKSSLSRLVAECKKAEEAYPDYIACPKVYKFKFEKLDAKIAASFLKNLGSLKIEPLTDLNVKRKSDRVAAAEMIRESMMAQHDGLTEHFMNLDPDSVEETEMEKLTGALSAYEKSFELFSTVLRSAGKKDGSIYIDEDSYWAPSVNARAWVLVRATEKTVTIVIHGDLDG